MKDLKGHSIPVDRRKAFLLVIDAAFLQYQHTEMWYAQHMVSA